MKYVKYKTWAKVYYPNLGFSLIEGCPLKKEGLPLKKEGQPLKKEQFLLKKEGITFEKRVIPSFIPSTQDLSS